jgi:hypothetical protein
MREQDHLRRIPAWAHERENPPPKLFDVERDKELMQKIRDAIKKHL